MTSCARAMSSVIAGNPMLRDRRRRPARLQRARRARRECDEPRGAARELRSHVRQRRGRTDGPERSRVGERIPARQGPGHGRSVPAVRGGQRGGWMPRGRLGQTRALERRAGSRRQRRAGLRTRLGSPGTPRARDDRGRLDGPVELRTVLSDLDRRRGPHETLPINCIDWYEAYAFCIWDGGFLPSEAEWEYAAAGGDEQREYPWGSTDPECDLATSSLYLISDCNYPPGSTACSGVVNIAPVGTATAGRGALGPARSGRRARGVDAGLVRAVRRPLRRLRLPDRLLVPGRARRLLRHQHGRRVSPRPGTATSPGAATPSTASAARRSP